MAKSRCWVSGAKILPNPDFYVGSQCIPRKGSYFRNGFLLCVAVRSSSSFLKRSFRLVWWSAGGDDDNGSSSVCFAFSFFPTKFLKLIKKDIPTSPLIGILDGIFKSYFECHVNVCVVFVYYLSTKIHTWMYSFNYPRVWFGCLCVYGVPLLKKSV